MKAPQLDSIIIAGAWRYVVAPEDILWLCRAVEAEGPEPKQVAQTLCNLFAFEYQQHIYQSLAEVAQSYSQPVNPRWFPDGKLHQLALARGHDTEARAILRRDFHSTREDFSAGTIEAVRKALELGPLDIPLCCTDYAAYGHINVEMSLLYAFGPHRNSLWSRAPHWQGYRISHGSKA